MDKLCRFQLLECLNDLRRSGTFCDVTIKVAEREFQVHKCVLASVSNYFKVCGSTEYHRVKNVTTEMKLQRSRSILKQTFYKGIKSRNNILSSVFETLVIHCSNYLKSKL